MRMLLLMRQTWMITSLVNEETPKNLNVIVQNEPLRETNGAEAQMVTSETCAGTCKEGAEETILRALALRHMELPVGDFIMMH